MKTFDEWLENQKRGVVEWGDAQLAREAWEAALEVALGPQIKLFEEVLELECELKAKREAYDEGKAKGSDLDNKLSDLLEFALGTGSTAKEV